MESRNDCAVEDFDVGTDRRSQCREDHPQAGNQMAWRKNKVGLQRTLRKRSKPGIGNTYSWSVAMSCTGISNALNALLTSTK